MTKIFLMFFKQVRTLFAFVLFIMFIYFPNLNEEINLLPFQIDYILWRDAWYYLVIFILVWFFIFFRISLCKGLRDRV